VIPNPELRKKFQAAGKGLVPWVNAMGLTAALAAYQDGQDWLDQLLVYLEANRDYVWDFLSKKMPSLRMAKPEGTYLAWINCRVSGIPGTLMNSFFADRV
jgi:cystathionine beta-lyase